MTFEELAEQYLKEFPEGIWVHFNDDSDGERSELYLDEDYITVFAHVLDTEVEGYYLDEYAYDVLEVFLKTENDND